MYHPLEVNIHPLRGGPGIGFSRYSISYSKWDSQRISPCTMIFMGIIETQCSRVIMTHDMYMREGRGRRAVPKLVYNSCDLHSLGCITESPRDSSFSAHSTSAIQGLYERMQHF